MTEAQVFDDRIFRSWPAVLLAAAGLSMLFGLIMFMFERLLTPTGYVSRATPGIMVLAFVGYILVAVVIRSKEIRN